MDIELIKNKGNIVNRMNRIDKLESEIKEILRYNNYFKKEESKKVLIELREYLNKLQKEYNDLRVKKRLLQDKIIKSCSHELLYKEDDIENKYCNCLICGSNFIKNEIDFDSIILTGSGCSHSYYHIEKIIYEIAENEEDILEVFSRYKDNEGQLKNIKLCRRKK